MSTLSPSIVSLFQCFSKVFVTSKTFSKAILLLSGAILCKGGRTVCSSLKVMGLEGEKRFQNYHRVLNRSSWSALQGSKILLMQIMAAFQQNQLVLVVDEHLERREGRKIRGLSCYHDSARSRPGHITKSFGLKWISMMVLSPIPRAARVFALPFLTVLAPSKKSNQTAGKKHKTTMDWTKQMLFQVRRWCPDISILLVADGGFACTKLALAAQHLKVGLICRLRLDARLYDYPVKKRIGRPATKGKKLLSGKQLLKNEDLSWNKANVKWYGGRKKTVQYYVLKCLWKADSSDPIELQVVYLKSTNGEYFGAAIMCTDSNISPIEIIERYIERWNIEVTFREAREHLGVETQRQWSDKAIIRTTPILFGLYALIVLLAQKQQHILKRNTAWYHKTHLSFSDFLVEVRKILWKEQGFKWVKKNHDMKKLLDTEEGASLVELLSEAV